MPFTSSAVKTTTAEQRTSRIRASFIASVGISRL